MTTNKLLVNISKYLLELSKIYDAYYNEKKLLMSNPKIMEYLYNKPMRRCDHLDDLLIEYDCTVKKVLINDTDKLSITSKFIIMTEYLNRYRIIYSKYNHCLVKYSELKIKNPMIKSLNDEDWIKEIFSDMSDKEKEILSILYDIEEIYGLNYFYHWSFSIEPKTKNSLNYDFYCSFVHDHKLIQFVIEYDKNYHFMLHTNNFKSNASREFTVLKNIHVQDIMKQHHLYQMNVHLLRLHRNSNIKNRIIKFINKITKTKKYIIINRIQPIKKFFTHIVNRNLLLFNDQYYVNHINFLQRIRKIDDTDDLFDEDVLDDDPFDDPNFTNIQPDNGYSISGNVFKNITNQKTFFTLPD